ncbi:MAG: proline dehydrogenase [Saprospiraceae bacterium]|jgi:proline dehydrogenase
MIDYPDPETQESSNAVVDFSNTEIAFHHKTDKELKKSAWLFSVMNKSWLVDAFTPLGLLAVKLHLPFVSSIIKATIYEQFVGGTALLKSQKTIDLLSENKVLSILDYGAEAKSSEKDFNHTMNECIRSIDFAATNESVPVVSAKITGLARFGLLERIQKGVSLNKEMKKEYRNVLKRMDAICHVANDRKVGVFFDSEESWIQDSIDHLVEIMMKRYNTKKVIVYNTFQMYRHDRLQYLIDSFDRANKGGYMLGAKLVRGAYMEKERARAEDLGYASPIYTSKQATDDAYNTALRFCVDNYKKIASCNATHNQESCLLLAELIAQKKIPKNHSHLNFCQLYGMSDNITFNLAAQGYNVAKYLVYGSVQDVVPYLSRRAKENSAVAGDMSREYALVMTEIKRRAKG